MSLTQQRCLPCHGGVPPLSEAQAKDLLGQLDGWAIQPDGKAIHKKWKFKNFAQALAFVNRIGEVAESEGHHPDILFGWGYADVTLTTHAIQGLSENDFIVAAKVDTV